MSARELGGSAGSSPIPRAAGRPRPTGGSPPGAAPPPGRSPAPAAGRPLAGTPRARKADRAVRLAPGILSPRKITIKGAPTGASPQPGQTLDTDLPRQDPGTYQTDGPDSTRPHIRLSCPSNVIFHGKTGSCREDGADLAAALSVLALRRTDRVPWTES